MFRLALEITFLLNKYIFLQMAYELMSQSRELNMSPKKNERGVGKLFDKNNQFFH